VDGSIVFARWCECALPCGHIGATWRIRLTCASFSPPEATTQMANLFSHFCTACGTVSSGMLGMPFPLKIVSSHGGSVSPSNTWFLGSPNSASQMASRSVQPVLHSSQQKVPTLYDGRPFPQKLPLPMGVLDPHLTMIPWAHPSTQPKGHLNQFSFFCTDDHRVSLSSYINNGKRLSVPCYFLAPCDKRKHTAHAHQQAASQASTDSAWRHPVWLTHSSLGFQRPVGRRSYRPTPQATIARLWLVLCNGTSLPPQNCPFSWGDLDPHLIHGSLGLPESLRQTASRLVWPFLQASLL